MSIRVSCPSCGSSFNVKSDFAGQAGKCPKCHTVIHVPAVSESTPDRTENQVSSPPKQTVEIRPATEKQKQYARELGVDFPENINRRDISKMIQAAQDNQTDGRYDRLYDVQQREGKQYEELRKEIAADIYADDKPLSKASADEMVKSLDERGIAAILITFDPYKTEDIMNGSGSVEIQSGDCLTGEDAKGILRIVGGRMLGKK